MLSRGVAQLRLDFISLQIPSFLLEWASAEDNGGCYSEYSAGWERLCYSSMADENSAVFKRLPPGKIWLHGLQLYSQLNVVRWNLNINGDGAHAVFFSILHALSFENWVNLWGSRIREGHIGVLGNRETCPNYNREQREHWQQTGIREHKRSKFLLRTMRENLQFL